MFHFTKLVNSLQNKSNILYNLAIFFFLTIYKFKYNFKSHFVFKSNVFTKFLNSTIMLKSTQKAFQNFCITVLKR